MADFLESVLERKYGKERGPLVEAIKGA